MDERKTVFISCGQYTEEEKEPVWGHKIVVRLLFAVNDKLTGARFRIRCFIAGRVLL